MSAPDPKNPQPNLQMTPVGFSPVSSPDAVGTVAPAQVRSTQFPLVIPLAILFLTLIFTTVRDIVALNKRMSQINEENAPALEILKKASNQQAFVDSLKNGVMKLAPTDWVAAQIAHEFFPAPPAPAKPTALPMKDANEPAANK